MCGVETREDPSIAGAPIEIAVADHGLALRRWRMEDADRLLAAIEASLPELRPWMPWANEPASLDSVRAYLEDGGTETAFGLFEADGEVVGALGLHDRQGPGSLEIGYWVRSDRTGRGYATAAVRALTEIGFACFPDVDRMEIRCHPDNAASAAIPPKLGYSLDTGRSGTQLVWVRFRS